MKRESAETVEGSKNTLYDNIMMGSCHSLYICPSPLNMQP